MDSEDLPDIPDEPLEYQWRPRTLTNIPAELVAGCAQGLEDPDEIAARFGLYGETWQQIKESKPFQLAVAEKKAELEKNGWVFRQKAAMGAEMVLEKVIVDLMSNETGTNTRLEGLKTLAKLANLEPKEDKGAAAGPGFQININLPGNNVTLGGQTVPLTPQIQPIDVLEIPLEDDE
jgi:hypothetical protein